MLNRHFVFPCIAGASLLGILGQVGSLQRMGSAKVDAM